MAFEEKDGELKTVLDKQFTLYYFDGRGLGETARTLFLISGVDFQDERMMALPEGQFSENLGRLPCLKVVDGSGEHVIGSSKAVNTYIARVLGLMGKDEFEAAKINMLCSHMSDIGEGVGKFFGYMEGAKVDNWEEQWFNTPNNMPDRSQRCLRWYLHRINDLVGENGFAVGDSFTLADAVIHRTLGERCENLEEMHYSGKSNDFMRYPMYASSWELVKKVLEEESPNLLRIVENFRNTPEMQAYLKSRGKQHF